MQQLGKDHNPQYTVRKSARNLCDRALWKMASLTQLKKHNQKCLSHLFMFEHSTCSPSVMLLMLFLVQSLVYLKKKKKVRKQSAAECGFLLFFFLGSNFKLWYCSNNPPKKDKLSLKLVLVLFEYKRLVVEGEKWTQSECISCALQTNQMGYFSWWTFVNEQVMGHPGYQKERRDTSTSIFVFPKQFFSMNLLLWCVFVEYHCWIIHCAFIKTPICITHRAT